MSGFIVAVIVFAFAFGLGCLFTYATVKWNWGPFAKK